MIRFFFVFCLPESNHRFPSKRRRPAWLWAWWILARGWGWASSSSCQLRFQICLRHARVRRECETRRSTWATRCWGSCVLGSWRWDSLMAHGPESRPDCTSESRNPEGCSPRCPRNCHLPRASGAFDDRRRRGAFRRGPKQRVYFWFLSILEGIFVN